MIIDSKGYKFRRGTGSPFDTIQAPGFDFGTHHSVPCQWCVKCKMAVDITVEKYNQHQVWGMKQTCRRCGGVLASAVYLHVGSVDNLENQVPNLLTKAQEWSLEGEKR